MECVIGCNALHVSCIIIVGGREKATVTLKSFATYDNMQCSRDMLFFLIQSVFL